MNTLMLSVSMPLFRQAVDAVYAATPFSMPFALRAYADAACYSRYSADMRAPLLIRFSLLCLMFCHMLLPRVCRALHAYVPRQRHVAMRYGGVALPRVRRRYDMPQGRASEVVRCVCASCARR